MSHHDSSPLQRRVLQALALVHAALEDPTVDNIAEARSFVGELLPRVRRASPRSTGAAELELLAHQLGSTYQLLERKVDGAHRRGVN